MKKVINGSTVLNLKPIEYPYAYKAYKDAFGSQWSPSIVPVTEDIEQFKKLSEAERHVYLHVFAQLSTMDVAAGGIINEINCKITSTEHGMALAAQGFDEAVHTDSYQYVADHLGIDDEWLWNRWIDVPEIKAKIDFAESVFESERYSFAAKYFFFSAVFEGVWFMTGFTPIFALSNQGKMARSAEILEYIAKDENHHTKFGIRTVNDIIKEDEDFDYKRFIVEISSITNIALLLEAGYVKYLFSKGGIFGYSEKEHNALASYKARANFDYAGFDHSMLDFTEEPKEPLFLGTQVSIPKMKNFFERTVTEYETGADLGFDDKDDSDDWLTGTTRTATCSINDIANGSCESCQ